MASLNLLAHLSVIPDPRVERNKKHDLSEMLFVAVCAVISGANGWTDIVEFAESKLEWLRRFVLLEQGIPVDDTFARVLSRVSPLALVQCLAEWARRVAGVRAGEVIAVDGKALRRSHDRRRGVGVLHLVRAWATEAGMALGQVQTAEKSNEITVIPELLRQLELRGAIVTLDAMGCQREVAAQIVEQGGDYVLAVKGNQPGLEEAVVEFFDTAEAHGWAGVEVSTHEAIDAGHGRVEQRRCWACGQLDSLPKVERWAGLSSFALVESERHVGDTVTRERRYFISSLAPDAAEISRAVRAHWEIENGLHWVLDMTFREDDSRIRRGHGAQNFATLRQFALSLLKRESTNVSIRKKRIRSGFNDAFREQVLLAAAV